MCLRYSSKLITSKTLYSWHRAKRFILLLDLLDPYSIDQCYTAINVSHAVSLIYHAHKRSMSRTKCFIDQLCWRSVLTSS